VHPRRKKILANIATHGVPVKSKPCMYRKTWGRTQW